MSATSRRALERLRRLLVAAVAVSIVHYADNVVNYADYPDPTSGPDPSREVIATYNLSFSVCTAVHERVFLSTSFDALWTCLTG